MKMEYRKINEIEGSLKAPIKQTIKKKKKRKHRISKLKKVILLDTRNIKRLVTE